MGDGMIGGWGLILDVHGSLSRQESLREEDQEGLGGSTGV